MQAEALTAGSGLPAVAAGRGLVGCSGSGWCVSLCAAVLSARYVIWEKLNESSWSARCCPKVFCRPQSWPRSAAAGLVTPNPWSFGGEKRPKAKPCAWLCRRAIGAFPKQADGAIPADFPC